MTSEFAKIHTIKKCKEDDFFEVVMFLEVLNKISTYINFNFSCLMMFTINVMRYSLIWD